MDSRETPLRRTRGIWQVEPNLGRRWGPIIHNDDVVIARCLTDATVPIEEARANARLIAAAPELLIALGQLLAERKAGYHTGSTGFDLASGAYARATSESDT